MLSHSHPVPAIPSLAMWGGGVSEYLLRGLLIDCWHLPAQPPAPLPETRPRRTGGSADHTDEGQALPAYWGAPSEAPLCTRLQGHPARGGVPLPAGMASPTAQWGKAQKTLQGPHHRLARRARARARAERCPVPEPQAGSAGPRACFPGQALITPDFPLSRRLLTAPGVGRKCACLSH